MHIFSFTNCIPLLSLTWTEWYAMYLKITKYDICYKKSTEQENDSDLLSLTLRSEDYPLLKQYY